MMFVDQGFISLDDPVGKILPEFADEDVETPATFHHLFTHTADMDGHFTDPWNDLEHVCGEAYPYLRIGKQHRYNGTSIAIGLKALEQLKCITQNSSQPLQAVWRIERKRDPSFLNAVTGRNLTFLDGIELGKRIWNLEHAIWTLQGRHRDMVHFTEENIIAAVTSENDSG